MTCTNCGGPCRFTKDSVHVSGAARRIWSCTTCEARHVTINGVHVRAETAEYEQRRQEVSSA